MAKKKSNKEVTEGVQYDASHFFNRELSLLEFNQRVLSEAKQSDVPLLERFKFLSIVASNLDEFLMVRVAGLIGQDKEGIHTMTADNTSPKDQLHTISKRMNRLYKDLNDAFLSDVLPELKARHVELLESGHLTLQQREQLKEYFHTQVMPILTPLALDPGHPFPHLRNKSLNLIAILTSGTVSLSHESKPTFALVHVPGVLPRLVRLRDEKTSTYVLLEDVIAMHINELFPGFDCQGAWSFRVVRNFDLSVDEEEADDLLESVKQEVRRRDRGNAVSIMIDGDAHAAAIDMLREALNVEPPFVFSMDGPVHLSDLSRLGERLEGDKQLRYLPFQPVTLQPFKDTENIFACIAKEDVLLHHPYESYDPVVRFIEDASSDPHVLAIKQTLYRTSGDSSIVNALMRAAENGKQVTALIEIKARFDEENNIEWARKLEEAGVHVVYGLVGLKTHAKAALVVKKEGERLVRYVHLATGNYNPVTAKLYTDISFFTSRQEITEDVSSLFNLLTSCTAPVGWHQLVIAPLGLFERILFLIERETGFARAGKKAKIVAKMNSLVAPDVILALYRASQAGVQIQLIVRGICCLKPGIPGLSEHISVISIVDRFLEHSRIFFFEAGGKQEVYAASADWMQRNFHRRVELMFPIDDERLKARVVQEILETQLSDNQNAWTLEPEGTYTRKKNEPMQEKIRSQKKFLELALIRAEALNLQEKNERPFVIRPVRNRPTKIPETETTDSIPPMPPVILPRT